MNQIVQKWSVPKITKVLHLIFIKGWRVWVILFAIEGLFSTTSDYSAFRRVVFQEPVNAEVKRSAPKFECDLD